MAFFVLRRWKAGACSRYHNLYWLFSNGRLFTLSH